MLPPCLTSGISNAALNTQETGVALYLRKCTPTHGREKLFFESCFARSLATTHVVGLSDASTECQLLRHQHLVPMATMTVIKPGTANCAELVTSAVVVCASAVVAASVVASAVVAAH